MYKQILVPIDLSDPELAKPAIANAVMMARQNDGTIRLVNVLPLTPVMLAEYVPPDFEVQQRKAAEDAIAIIAKESGLEPSRVSTTVRQGGIYQEILEEANNIHADLIVMSSHRPQRHAVRTYFLGSNAGHVVRYAKCSVLVVRT
ncbi:MAG TPA: universal stress protein [Xanthobacteraceae bacterium]|jgi:nucleotide-binding universal stress UspA family protein|nr:universal stress protein [Xanthobacteraceae bacterium]